MPWPPDFLGGPSIFVPFLTYNPAGFALSLAQSCMQTMLREVGGMGEGGVFFLPALKAGAVSGGWEHHAPAVTSVTEWIWGWLLNFQWTSHSSKYHLAPDFPLFVEHDVLLVRALSCWLCSRKVVWEEGTLHPSAPIAFRLWFQPVQSHRRVPQESRRSTQLCSCRSAVHPSSSVFLRLFLT